MAIVRDSDTLMPKIFSNLNRKSLFSLFLLFVTSIFASSYSHALPSAGQVGLGLIAGQPSGLSGRYVLNENSSIDGGLSWRLGEGSGVSFFADYLIDKPELVKTVKEQFPVHFGIGAAVGSYADTTIFAARIPGGISYFFREQPVQLFLELAGFFTLVPDMDFDIEGFLGARYYF